MAEIDPVALARSYDQGTGPRDFPNVSTAVALAIFANHILADRGQVEPVDSVTLNFDLAGLYVGDDGVTFGDLVVAQAARALLARERDVDSEFRRRIRSVSAAEIKAAIQPLIADAIEESFQPTDTYGQPKGPKITLREAIVAEVQKQTGRRTGHGMGGNRSILEEVVEVEVGRALRAELQKAVAAAKDEVLEAVRGQAADVIAETIRRTARV